MKKILLMAAVLLSSVATFAQYEPGTVSLQPKVGLNLANITDGEGSDLRVGLAVGAELEYQITDIFSVSGGLLYSMQGAKEDDETLKADYINVPIMANVYVTKGLAVKLGIQPGFNVNSKFSSNGTTVDTNKLGADAKTVDFTIPVGLSYQFPGVPIVIDARYNWGLTKMYDGLSNKNSVFQFTVGYKFAL